MSNATLASPTTSRQYPGAKPIRSNGAATIQTRDEQNGRLSDDKCHYHSTNKRSVTDLTPRQIPGVSNLNKNSIAHLLDLDEKRRAKPAPDYSWFKPPRPLYYCYPLPAPVLLLGPGPQPVALLPATCLVESDYTWQGDTNDYPFDTQWFLTPRQKLAKKSLTKQLNQEVPMVIQHPTADILPNSHTLPVAPNGTRVWASASPTPGLAQMIDTKREAATLAAARKNNSPYLIGPSARWNGAQ